MAYPVMPQMPLSMAKGLKKNPNFNTVIQPNAAGVGTSSVAIKPYATWDFEWDMDHITGQESLASSVMAQFIGVYMACQGRNNLFQFSDPQDNSVANMQFGVGDGTTTKFQLSRGIGGATDIIQNIVGSIQVFVNSVLTSVSLSSTGVVTFSGAPALNAVLTWTGSFCFLCRFSADTVDSVRSFTTNSGVDQWDISSVKFSSEFVAAGTSGIVFAGGGTGGGGLTATPQAVQLNPSGPQTISVYPLTLVGLDSSTPNQAASGFLSLAHADTLAWRNNANSADLPLGINASDQLTFNGSAVGGGGGAVSSVFGRTGVVVSATNDYGFSQLSGTAASTQLPNPTTSLIGGVKAITAVASKWVNSISTSGTPTLTQPAFSDISGVATAAQVPSKTLNFQAQQSPITPASNVETTLFTYTMPAGTIGLGTGVRITSIFQHSTGATATTYKAYFGASSFSLSTGATGVPQMQWNLLVMNDQVTANSQVMSKLISWGPSGAATVPVYAAATPAENTSGTIVIKFTVTVTSTTDVYTPFLFLVELVN